MAVKRLTLAKYILVVIAIGIPLGAYLLFMNKNTAQTVKRAVISGDQTTYAMPDTVTGKPPDPVSLAALMQKKFNGSDLAREAVLEENEWYTRYQISYTSGMLRISGIMNVPKIDPPAGYGANRTILPGTDLSLFIRIIATTRFLIKTLKRKPCCASAISKMS